MISSFQGRIGWRGIERESRPELRCESEEVWVSSEWRVSATSIATSRKVLEHARLAFPSQ